jgi:hypothetical protein
MYSKSAPIIPLIATRHQDFQHDLDVAMQGNDTLSYCLSPGATIGIVYNLLLAPRPIVNIFYIDDSWILTQKAMEKAKTSADVPFVSTNDILTSWYFKLCKCDIGIIAMNFRNRFQQLTNSHAGNYEALVAYQHQDFDSPSLIRKSLPGYRRALSGPLRGFLAAATSTKIGLLSNWVTFYRDLELDNCRQLLHLPFFENKNVAFQDISVIFRPSRDRLALLTLGRSIDAAKLERQPALSTHLTAKTYYSSSSSSSFSFSFSSSSLAVGATALTTICCLVGIAAVSAVGYRQLAK